MPRGVNTQDEGRIQGRNVVNANSSNIVAPGIVTDGLVLHLDAGNYESYPIAGTTWYDLSGRGNNGTLTSGPVYARAGGGSISFDGTNDRVIIPSTSAKNTFNGKTALTISVWAYLDAYHPDDGSNFVCWPISNSSITSPFTVIFINVSKLGVLTVSVGDGTNRTIFTSSFTVGLSSWNNFGLIWDGANLYAFLNNSISTTSSAAAYTINYTGTADIFISGYNEISTYWIDGNVSQVSIYDRNLTPTEISQNYNATRARFNI